MAIRLVRGFGQSMSMTNWQRSKYNVHRLSWDCLRMRLNMGYTVEEAMAIPKRVSRDGRMSPKNARKVLQYPFLTFEQKRKICNWAARQLRGMTDP
jgi:hypothetical protein